MPASKASSPSGARSHRSSMLPFFRSEGHVIGIEDVLDLQLPIAGIDVAMHAGVEGELAVRRAVAQIVDAALHRPDMLLEGHAAGSEAGEHEAAILAGAR